MLISNTLQFKKLALALGALALGACSLPKPEPKDISDDKQQRSASFYVASMNEKVLAETQAAAYSLTNERKFLLEVCLKDYARSKNIQNQLFKVEGQNQELRTDLNGCLSWTETVRFNPLLESKYVLLKKVISGQGIFRGATEARWAINPWGTDDKAPMIVNLKKTTVPQLVEKETEVQKALQGEINLQNSNGQTTNTYNRLWVEDGRLFITEQSFSNKGMQIQVEMKTVPSIQMQKSNGENLFRPLTRGAFRTQLSLIHKVEVDKKEIFRELAQGEVQVNEVTSGSLSIRNVIELASIPTRGQIFVGLRIEAQDSNIGLTPFEGLYLVGEHDRFKGTFFARLASRVTEEKNFRISNLLSSNLSADEIMNLPLQKAKIEVAPLEFRFLRVGKETTTTREVVVVVKACLKNGLDQSPIRSHKFKVTKFRTSETEPSQTIDVTTDNNSCLVWDETVSFRYFECQRFVPGHISIASQTLGMNEKLDIMINPWEAWASPGRDARYIQPSEKQITQCADENRLRSQMILDSYTYNTMSYDYEIDNTLNLSVKKKVLFKVEPRVLAYSNLSSGRNDIERLRDGLYLLKVAVVKNKDYDNNNTYVTHDTVVAPALNGIITAELTFKTNDLKALGNRNTILIEVFPVNEEKYKKSKSKEFREIVDFSSGLESSTFQGVVLLNLDDASRSLKTTSLDKMKNYFVNFTDVKFDGSIIEKIIQDGKLQLAKQQELRNAQAKAETFARYANLDLVRLNDLKKATPFARLTGVDTNRLPHGGYVGTQTTHFNQLYKESAGGSLNELTNLIANGKMSAKLTQQMCMFWFYEHFEKQLQQKNLPYNKTLAQDHVRRCMQVATTNPQEFFQTEKRLMIKSVRDFKFVKGYNQGLTVGSSFSLSNSRSESLSRSTSASAKFGLSKKFFDLISVSADIAYTVTKSIADSESESNSISVGAQTSMAVQVNHFDLILGSYEQCATVRLNPLLFVKDQRSAWWGKKRDILNIFSSKIKNEDLADLAHSGFMFCSGTVQNTPIKRTETYYLIAQDQSQTAMQDNADERNRNFFVALRGKSEFNKFLFAIKSETEMPETSAREDNFAESQLSDLQKAFTFGLPIFPANFLESAQ
ncbi:MAG: hypothetical protein ACLGGX_06570 [Bdellovibrionia bacterium]